MAAYSLSDFTCEKASAAQEKPESEGGIAAYEAMEIGDNSWQHHFILF